jgi:hypothetical protein
MSDAELSEKELKELFVGGEDVRQEVKLLFSNLKKEQTNLTDLLANLDYENPIYRFYHHSFKVYFIQSQTIEIVEKLKALLPDREMNKWFVSIIDNGTGKEFKREDNNNWLEVTRPMVEAFFHARYFLEMAVKYASELEYPPNSLPNGWALFLYLYNLR